MKSIFKYPVAMTATQVIPMPKDYKILTDQVQNHDICVWVEVDRTNEFVGVVIKIVGTGHAEVEKGDKYIATVQENHLVWHIYETNL